MKQLSILLLLIPTLMFGQRQERNENMTMWWSINVFRNSNEMSVLTYHFSAQHMLNKRVKEIQRDFAIDDNGGEECDGEIIFQADDYMSLLKSMTDLSELYFDRDINYICIAIEKSDKYYAVARIWSRI